MLKPKEKKNTLKAKKRVLLQKRQALAQFLLKNKLRFKNVLARRAKYLQRIA
jgi:hypothetical protein